ncbi:MAG TPA: hypothetical protein VLV18_07515 [Terriglobales bacterium]|nr:hypothetical protein [Terriglobales bacterium]
MQKRVLIALILILAILPMLGTGQVFAKTALVSPPLSSSGQKTAVILDSLEKVYPMGFYGKMILGELQSAGYTVTVLADGNVTLDFLVSQLNNYNVIIWRTDAYTWMHREFWYVGQLSNSAIQEKYASDFTNGWINGNAGIVGVSLDFIYEHFPANSLSNVKLAVLMSTDSGAFAPVINSAGTKSVIYCIGSVSLSYSLIDDLTGQMLSYLVHGQSVYNAVWNTVSPFVNGSQPEDNLDSNYAPPFYFAGDGTVTIT